MGWEGLIDSLMEDRIVQYIVGALVAAMVLLLVAIRLWAGGRSNDDKISSRQDAKRIWPFYAKRPLTEVEQALYHSLAKALPEHIILAQVQLSQLLGVRKGYNFQEWFNRINRLSVDFVVCTHDANVLAVIELDDGNRDRIERQSADMRAHKALAAAELRLLRWQVWALPDEAEIRRQLLTPNQAPKRDKPTEAPLRATH